MEDTQNQSGSQEAKDDLTGALSLSILHADPNSSLVQDVNALIDSVGQCYGPFRKLLADSDVAAKQNRFLLRKRSMGKFIKLLLKPHEDPGEGVPVRTFNTAGKAYPMKLKRRKPNSLVLLRNWKKFVRENQLESEDVVTIWAFRAVQTGGLCFVISYMSE